VSTAPRERVPRPEGTPEGPRTIGGYTLLAPLGEGGMGVVHLARRSDGQRVALKVLRPHVVGDDETRARLAREVGSLRRVRSRWVAEIIDADPWAPVPYIATRYVPGLSLHDEVLREGPVRGDDLAWLARCLLEGIAAVHEAGVLHRDVKPSNVLMEGRTPVLIDFGLARVADDPKLTQTGWLLGTPGYLAPEVLYGDDPTPAVDVHAWAATVAYAATGRPPYGRGPSMAVMDRARRGEHDLTGVPSPLREVLDASLDPDPARRPALAQVLTWLRGQGPVPVGRAGRAARTPQPPPPPRPAPAETMPLSLLADEPEQPHEDATRLETRLETQVEPAPWDVAAPNPALTPPPQASLGERTRRAALLGAGALAVAAGLAAYPWTGLACLLVLALVLRTGSIAASAVGERRRARGAKWYDGPRLVLGAPWGLVRSVPATLLAGLWAFGLAVAAMLLCYAVAAPLTVTLPLAGLVLVGALWWGPGGSRLRSPVNRVVRPLAGEVRRWAIALAIVVAVAGLLGSFAARGADWLPAGGPPFSGLAD
jgi:serine/threonine protein kinase